MSTIWLDPCLKTLCIPTALILSTSSNINTRHKAACCAGFRILLWANLSWCSKAEGPLTPASRFRCLPAACCHGYLSSVAGQCSSSLTYDTTSFTKHPQLCCCHHKPQPPQQNATWLSWPAWWKWQMWLRFVNTRMHVCGFAILRGGQMHRLQIRKCHQISSSWLHQTHERMLEQLYL